MGHFRRIKWVSLARISNETMDYCLQTRLGAFDFVDKQVRSVSVKLRAYCRKHYKKDYYLLRSVPGVGSIVACGILCELGDLRRFKNFKQLASYVGLIPSVHQSGDNLVTSGLTTRANRIMRSYLVEATWVALRFDPVMQGYYRSHQGKDVKRILMKVARKLLSRIHAIIKTETPYQIGVVS
ncbi:IS110 family transposase [Aquimarina sp. 2201CG14-23]|uniref:IS110 family transposase n=1 Tax=Aquimarina mycalae TaxID=3040073 RepID=UPI0032AF1DE1